MVKQDLPQLFSRASSVNSASFQASIGAVCCQRFDVGRRLPRGIASSVRSGWRRLTGEAPLPLPAAGGPGCRLGRAPKPTPIPGWPGSLLKQTLKPSHGCGGLRSSRAAGSISEVGGGGLASGSCGWPPTGLYSGRSGEASGAPCGLRRHFCVAVCSGEVLVGMGRVSKRSGTVAGRGSAGTWCASLVGSICAPEFRKQFWRGGFQLGRVKLVPCPMTWLAPSPTSPLQSSQWAGSSIMLWICQTMWFPLTQGVHDLHKSYSLLCHRNDEVNRF
ncbi:uncharacterized protein [Mobula birostris]|uniref:uncharacterized protein n=1 Tax=Mobula birostris TaxID=1983395 RepID=UPI003B280411